jgi:hypothetical protein
MTVEDIPAVADRLDAEKIVTAGPSDEGTVIPGSAFVVGVTREGFEAIYGPVRRFVYLVHDAVSHLRVETFQVVDGLFGLLDFNHPDPAARGPLRP